MREGSTRGEDVFSHLFLQCFDPFQRRRKCRTLIPDHETYQGEHPRKRQTESPQHKLPKFGKPLGEVVEASVKSFLPFFQTSQPLDDLPVGDPWSFLESLGRGYGEQQKIEYSESENSFHTLTFLPTRRT